MFRFALVMLLTAGSVATAAAQDATTTVPQAYKTSLENDYVQVVRVHYDAGVKLPAHTHPLSNVVYVYLNDSDGVVFRHVSGRNHTVTRQPVKTGSVRVSGGGNESHEVENTSKTASDFLRVVLKTPGGGGRMGRLAPTDPNFANDQIRITRMSVAPGQKALIEAKNEPALRIAIRQGVKQWTTPPADLLKWLDKGTTEEFSVTGDFPVDIVRIDFLTRPKN